MGDLSAPAPRVNGELLSRYVGRKVLLVGKVVRLDGGVVQLLACDGRTVRVALKGAPNFTSEVLEFEALVDSADGVTEVEHSSFTAGFGATPRRSPRKSQYRRGVCRHFVPCLQLKPTRPRRRHGEL